ncbi:cardiotrophin-like cytokine factor 1 [Mobula hypostoma]|uniref:cardiotrophin-like cytokine factor 1 n=1 Tax=Mobula hypostoma TaxID=723540 RepID=UPI002FC27945
MYAAGLDLLVLLAFSFSPSLGFPDVGATILRSYHLTKYLERQVQALSVSYMEYLGPPFDNPDFDPPRAAGPGRIPSPTLEVGAWRGLDDRHRLWENLRAYRLLLTCLSSLEEDEEGGGGSQDWGGGEGRPSLHTALLHLRAGLQGLSLGIGAALSSLGHPPDPPPPPTPPSPPPPPPTPPAPSAFLRKLSRFWLLRELRAWLLRSAKDFTRLRRAHRKIPRAREDPAGSARSQGSGARAV